MPSRVHHHHPSPARHRRATSTHPLNTHPQHPPTHTGVTEVLDKFTDQEFTCEYKYDGERAQIHVTEDGKVSVRCGAGCGEAWWDAHLLTEDGKASVRCAGGHGGAGRRSNVTESVRVSGTTPQSPPLPPPPLLKAAPLSDTLPPSHTPTHRTHTLLPVPHCPQIYSRNSENNTGKYPDVAARIPGLLKPGVKSVVLDAEAVAYDREHGKVLPFQVGVGGGGMQV